MLKMASTSEAIKANYIDLKNEIGFLIKSFSYCVKENILILDVCNYNALNGKMLQVLYLKVSAVLLVCKFLQNQ